MSTALAPQSQDAAALLEQVLVGGDLEKLSPAQRLSFYEQVCASTGLNPLTQPLLYVRLNNKLTLYAKKDATDQLRRLHRVSVQIVSQQAESDLYVVRARATMPDGRADEEIGVVGIAGLKGEALANAYMKAVTKAKRRVTLSVCGLGLLDDSEIDSIPGGARVNVDRETGEILEAPAALPAGGGSGAGRRPLSRERLESLYEDRRAEAEEYGLDFEAHQAAWSPDEVIARGNEIKAAIEQAKGGR
jgi:hypothetical protein